MAFKMKGYQHSEGSPLLAGGIWDRVKAGASKIGQTIKDNMPSTINMTNVVGSSKEQKKRNKQEIIDGNKKLADQKKRHAANRAMTEEMDIYKKDYYKSDEYKQRDGTTKYGGKESDDQYQRRKNDSERHAGIYANRVYKQNKAKKKRQTDKEVQELLTGKSTAVPFAKKAEYSKKLGAGTSRGGQRKINKGTFPKSELRVSKFEKIPLKK